jgi:hypothetical protein
MGEKSLPADTCHRLSWLDQLAFELFRATGRNQLMQCLWLYEREVNLPALAQTYDRLSALAFNRLIAPSCLPGGRPRWVKPSGPPAPLQPNMEALPRTGLMAWANRQARETIDPVSGPAWRMAVQRFDDGSTAVSLVGSHLVVDGMGSVQAIAAAADGVALPNPYLPQGASAGLSGCASDAWQILSDTPRTLAALARIAWAGWRRPVTAKQNNTTAAEYGGSSLSAMVELPAVAVSIHAPAWDACARRLGGRENMLLPGFVATLAFNLGRCRASDGTVSLLVPIDRRQGLTDQRALAIEFRTMTIAPEGLTTSLRPLNAPFKALLRGARENQTAALDALLPAIAWMPPRFSAALVNRLFAYADALPVSCSNLGTLPDGLARIDGEPCARLLTRAVDANVSRRDLERSHGHLVAVASRYGNTVSVSIEAFQQAPRETTVEDLRRAVSRTLAGFGLEAVIEA